MHALVLPLDRSAYLADLPATGYYEPLCVLVGGLLEAVTFTIPGGSTTATLYLDEEGKLKGRPLNPVATFLTRGQLIPGDFIVGPAVVFGPPTPDGWDTDVPEEVVVHVDRLAGVHRPAAAGNDH